MMQTKVNSVFIIKIHTCIKGYSVNTTVASESRFWRVNDTKIFADTN